MNAIVRIAGLSAEQQLEALHRLWDEQQEVWNQARASFISRLSEMRNENTVLGEEVRLLVAERDALLAEPSKLFEPRGRTSEGRQDERTAFAAGLHHATTLQRRPSAGRCHQQEESCHAITKSA